MTSSPELPPCDCDTELSLGHPAAPAPPARRHATAELKQKQAAATLSTELQAMAILRVARRAAAAEEEASGDGGAAGRLSMRRSMEWFLQRRWEPRRLSLRDVTADRAAASPSSSSSSSSFSCLTDDSSRI